MTALRSVPVAFLAAFAAALTLLAPKFSLAQQREEVSVHIEAPQKMYVGDTQDLQIVVRGSRNVEAPDLSGLRDFVALYRAPQDSSSTMTTIFNGRMDTKVSITYSHLYALTPRHAGQLEIPALNVVVDGRVHTTQPFPIEVVEAVQAPDFKLEVMAAPTAAFVGQPVHVKLVWTIAKDIRGVSLSLSVSGPDHDLMPGPQLSQVRPNDLVQLRLNGEQTAALYQNNTVTIDRVIIPGKPGVLTIGPARADFLAVIGQRQRRALDSPWDDRSITDREFSSAPALTIQVADLPAEGRPANFSGLVGDYQIVAGADATNVSVGDPINLSLNVTGPFPLSLVPPLDLSRQPDLKSRFRIPREPALPQVTQNGAAFQTMLRARTPDVNEIPAIELNYFDPDAKQYKVAATRPIPLTVRASTSVTLPDEPEEEVKPNAPPANRPGGLPDIDRTPLSAGAGPLDIGAQLRSPTMLAILILPPLMCAIAATTLAFFRWRERDPAARRRNVALSRLQRTLKRSAGSLDRVAQALSNFAADLFDHPRDTLTGAHAADLLRQTETSAGSRLADLLHACDQTRFGVEHDRSAAQQPATLAQQALAAARSLARQLRRSGRAAA